MKNGFTLIELLIVSSAMGILLIAGVANYNNFNRKRMVREAGLNLLNNLRYAQEKASSGEKPSVCTAALDGWKLKFSSNHEYEILPVCGGVEIDSERKNYQFNSLISKVSGSDSLLFKVLAQGVEGVGPTGETEISLEGFNGAWRYKIKVSKSGEINDEGFE